MELDFLELQTKQVSLIQARAYFAGVAVIPDDGNAKPTWEGALREKGVAVLVSPVMSGDLGSQATHQITVHAMNFVTWMINPEINARADGAQKGILAGIREIVRAVLSYQRTGGDTFWTCPANVFEISVRQPGLIAYDVFFQKQFTFAP